ncbi:MAG: DNA-formamidopyrimidine glycosylase family protein [Myxococcota bacterium]
MPELPEAEHVRQIFEDRAVGRTIQKATIAKDPIVFDKRSAAWVRKRLAGRTVVAAHRHGKYIWLEINEGPHPIVHLGMTGTVRFPNDEPLRLEASPKIVDRAWPPRFTKVELRFDDGGMLAYTNARRLGRILFREDPRQEAPIGKLGFDPWTEMPSPREFDARLSRRGNAVLKALLLDQKFAAGVGNWIADEVLYQARLDPRRRVQSLSPDEIARLRKKLRHVIATAVRANARKHQFPKSWLFHRRWGKEASAKTHEGRAIEFLEIGGRTTAWVPALQG